MRETSETCGRGTSGDMPSAIFSPALVSGRMPCDKQAGLMTDPCSPVRFPANLSLPLDGVEVSPTSATCGRRCSGSSASAALSRSLANRLRTLSTGSTLYRLTWKERATASGRLIPALRASVPRTSGNGCGGWPTPTGEDHKSDGPLTTQRVEDALAKGIPLPRPTQRLRNIVLLAGWPTPQASDSKGISTRSEGKRRPLRDEDLPTQTVLLMASGPPPTGSPAETGKPGQLNPSMSRWLMGLPPEWDLCAPKQLAKRRK